MSTPSKVITDEMRANQQAELDAMIDMIDTIVGRITRFRESHYALLEAAQGAVDLLDRSCGYASDFDERLAALKAAIANAERSAP